MLAWSRLISSSACEEAVGNREHKRLELFNRFSQNWSKVQSAWPLSRYEQYPDSVVCPLCMRLRFRSALEQDSVNPLTAEDVPPSSLEGNPRILTCKSCNNTAGTQLDAKLGQLLRIEDAKAALPRSEAWVRLSTERGSARGILTVPENGVQQFSIQKGNAKPIDEESLLHDFKFPPRTYRAPDPLNDRFWGGWTTELPMTITFEKMPDDRLGEIALLRIGYLLGFATLGHSFLLNPGLKKVRAQIADPAAQVIDGPFLLPAELSENHIGVNAIVEPAHLRCYVVSFVLETKSAPRRFNVILPLPTDRVCGIYERIGALSIEQPTTIKLIYIGDEDFVAEDGLVAYPKHLWREDFLADTGSHSL